MRGGRYTAGKVTVAAEEDVSVNEEISVDEETFGAAPEETADTDGCECVVLVLIVRLLA
ncbi:hypothetical protein GCM10007377_10810 [Galliscardovia ingluviei]|uniref:Uncharacterized protein n=1 Tax=Galliscardovia ingluviei TaxID=1769422 RepID=A0A8J3AHB4_9BIFI|nr:hypothetical protein GCM10007377_10810 [Galliscardovia ingluviei]